MNGENRAGGEESPRRVVAPGSAGQSSAASDSRLSGFTDDLAEQTARRLALLMLVYAGIWTIGITLVVLVLPRMGTPVFGDLGSNKAFLPAALLLIVLSLAVFALIATKRIPPQRIENVGLAYLLVSVAIAGVVNFWNCPPEVFQGGAAGAGKPGLSWSAAWILIFTMFLPAHPRKLVPTVLAAASLDGVGLHVVGAIRGIDVTIPPGYLLLRFLPNYIFAAVGIVHVKFVRRLTRQVGRAREMGSYRLERRLGEGGMGEVWQASHRMLARPAAVKLIRPDILDAENEQNARMVLSRFEREAQATAALSSPHTIDLFDFGISRDGTFYYVMELLEGLDLNSLVARFGPMPPERTVHVLRQACHSLADAHSRGLVHRDIKPANLYVCRLGLDYDFIKVLDFGLVKSGPGALPGDSMKTRADVATGTPAFMPPEMVLGDTEIDGRADLYALGCVAYWMLTGKLVFEETNPMKMVLRHAQEPPEPPSKRIEAPLPPGLERLVLACLEKDPEDRPASATEVARQLEELDLAAPWTPESAREWWETRLPVAGTGDRLPETGGRVLVTGFDGDTD